MLYIKTWKHCLHYRPRWRYLPTVWLFLYISNVGFRCTGVWKYCDYLRLSCWTSIKSNMYMYVYMYFHIQLFIINLFIIYYLVYYKFHKVLWLFPGVSSPMWTSSAYLETHVIITDPNNATIGLGCILGAFCSSDLEMKKANMIFFTIVFCVIFLPLLAVFLWLYIVVAREVWVRRKPVSAIASGMFI